MSHKRGTRRTWADELSAPAAEDGEPTPGLTTGDLTNPPSTTATQGSYSPQGIDQGSGSWQNLSDAPSEPEHVSPDAGDTEEEEHFTIPAKAMKATERLNTIFNRIRTSMNVV
ncbi:hypothetical protein M422DRAFT_250763 [Sphaerobolus stellatus SS14]|uniref:Uncharacterized protein n=1 Tax=Sphaerobolus stellatus (strain SS14) TaxID=990650 RepID=A0A0C9VSJ8_SPHS4|nr:hypothetical protein M422DRAFT_250763 [Sphaerobolus stellatus SS14]